MIRAARILDRLVEIETEDRAHNSMPGNPGVPKSPSYGTASAAKVGALRMAAAIIREMA